MSANYDLIATVSIDINSTIVDDASFDNLLIVGPLPKVNPVKQPALVGVYNSLDAVTEAGWSISGEGADPVGLAALVAFSQSPAPAKIYIAPIQAPDMEAEDVLETVKRACATAGWYVLTVAGVEDTKYPDIAAYIEKQEKMFLYSETGFFADEKKATVENTYFRTAGIVANADSTETAEKVSDVNKYIATAFAAKWLNFESGTETAAYKQLATVQPSTFSSSEMAEITKNNLNFFVTVGNRNITIGGMTVGGEWMDVIRFRDWLKNDMQEKVVSLFATNSKIPFTDGGIALIQNQMLASLKAGQDLGGIAEDEYDADGNTIPGYTTSVPTASLLPAEERAARKISGLTFKARLSGAIHFAELHGSLTYEL